MWAAAEACHADIKGKLNQKSVICTGSFSGSRNFLI